MLVDLALRPCRPDERNYVWSTWVKSYSSGTYERRYDGMAADYAPVVLSLLDRCRVRVAHWADNEDALAGFVVDEETSQGYVLHYLATKTRYRKLGVASWIRETLPTTLLYTHQTRAGDRAGLVRSTWSFRRWLIATRLSPSSTQSVKPASSSEWISAT